MTDGWCISCEIALIGMSLDFADDQSWNIGSGNGLVPSGNKPLPEPMLTQISRRHIASLGHNELNHCGLVTPYGNIDLDQHWLK